MPRNIPLEVAAHLKAYREGQVMCPRTFLARNPRDSVGVKYSPDYIKEWDRQCLIARKKSFARPA